MVKNPHRFGLFEEKLFQNDYITDKYAYCGKQGYKNQLAIIYHVLIEKNYFKKFNDSTKKKIIAVNEFIDKLKLSNLSAYSDRVESPEFIEKFSDCFDLVISRATVPLIQLINYSLPLIKEKAYLAAMKGGDLHDEISKAELKHKAHIKKLTVFEMAYKPSNIRNEKEKKLILLELYK